MNDPRTSILESFCAAQFPEKQNIQLENWISLVGGWESEIFAFDLCSGAGLPKERLRLVLRLYFGNSAGGKAANEFRAMRLLYNAGYPVPQVYAIARSDSPLGQPFILMDHVDGEPLWRLMERAKGKQSQSWLELFCSLFARLHSLDWRVFLEKDQPHSEDPYCFVDAWLRDARQTLSNAQFDDFTPVVDWLEQQRDRLGCMRPAPLHQDFHPNNILVHPDGAAVVIDWTSFTVSDPRFDLAWTLILGDAYIGEAFREALFHEYEHQSGAPVLEIDTFEVFACVRRLFDISVSLGQGAKQRGMRPEAIEAMKRDMQSTRRVYRRLVQHTGIRIPRLEAW